MRKLKQFIKKTITTLTGNPLPLSLSRKKFIHKTIDLSHFFTTNQLIYCNINFDDQSPVYREIDGRDYGGSIDFGISKKLEFFLKQNPDIAITSFVIPNFKGNTKEFRNKFLLTNSEYLEWVNYYNNLAKRYNVEYSMHGFFHLQKENPFFQAHTEFAFKSHDQALECIQKSIKVFDSIGWPITGFRQPGWDLSSSVNLPEIAKKCNLKYIAANSYDAGYNASCIERVSNYYPTLVDGIINFPQNIELDWSIDKILNKIDFLVEIKAFISIKAHFVDKDLCNCLNEDNLIKLNKIAIYIKSNFNNKIKFVTLNTLSNLIDKFNH